jgi:hypothetical protein
MSTTEWHEYRERHDRSRMEAAAARGKPEPLYRIVSRRDGAKGRVVSAPLTWAATLAHIRTMRDTYAHVGGWWPVAVERA